MEDPSPKLTRREQYALTTKLAIVDAARRLFSERGYFATTVDDIAAAADVASATVYSSAGGKQGLISEMVRLWQTDPLIANTLDGVRASTDPYEVIAKLSAAARQIRERWADVIVILLTTAPHDSSVAEQLAPASQYYRRCIEEIAQRLADLGGLRKQIEVADAADILWFYFGYSGLNTLHDENRWSYDRAESWLRQQACRELLNSGLTPS
jgi:AcrR family transcriptional regulator